MLNKGLYISWNMPGSKHFVGRLIVLQTQREAGILFQKISSIFSMFLQFYHGKNHQHLLTKQLQNSFSSGLQHTQKQSVKEVSLKRQQWENQELSRIYIICIFTQINETGQATSFYRL